MPLPHRTWLFGLVLPLLLACEREGSEPSRASATSAPLTTPERRAVVSEPDWSGGVDEQALSLLSPGARGEVAKSKVPVLAPSAGELAASAIVTAGPVYVAVSSSAAGVTLTLHGTKLAYHYAKVSPAIGDRELRGTKGWVTRESGIWSASWTERGVAWMLDLECATPSDGRCADEHFLLDRVADLSYVGGEGAERGGRP